MSEIELKACPMCGGSDLKIMGDAPLQAILGGYRVYCDAPSCQCQGRHSGNREKAIRAWNRRPPQWQPIESAPKDGTRLMLWDSRNGGYAVTGAWVAGSADDHETITHWQPLPAAPEVMA